MNANILSHMFTKYDESHLRRNSYNSPSPHPLPLASSSLQAFRLEAVWSFIFKGFALFIFLFAIETVQFRESYQETSPLSNVTSKFDQLRWYLYLIVRSYYANQLCGCLVSDWLIDMTSVDLMHTCFYAQMFCYALRLDKRCLFKVMAWRASS